MYCKTIPFSSLLGKTLSGIEGKIGDEEMIFITSEGEKYKLFHDQDCCETVSIEDIAGDIEDLIGAPILLAEEVVHDINTTPEGIIPYGYQDNSFTWTFYKLSTINGSITIRWYGGSNGYYSESVDFKQITEKERG